ncbi:hypothetical protein SeMB42_g00747 [Synchytrium endobioticum]|uniref:Band 7 domain-containing protein n=1 Tax=Synchytrium endobioticum TaxID=286115 RepID=A0A507CH50_9FUNG|nr:hypothetical protein SeLEV6574_g07974 [Synchytrium endobioticum]TPX53489.1 hypothetical protein SeMB42_g00747 [Synchytrium endobioticum]
MATVRTTRSWAPTARVAGRAIAAQQSFARQTVARRSHTLTVPYTHLGVTPFEKGVPAEQVRGLSPVEKRWDFWTTSNAFLALNERHGFMGFKYVPYGEAWVIERGNSFSRIITNGWSFVMPMMERIKVIKNAHPVVMGVVTPLVKSKDGADVNGYAVIQIQVTDYERSAYYVDAESNRLDSERGAARVTRRILQTELANISLSNGEISSSDKASIAAKITAALQAKASEFGLEVQSVEIRGAFPATSNVPDKLRALDPPLPAEDASGHQLSADYWADALSPPFFEKRKFGSEKEVRTPAAVSLEWCIPSPPDFHHFNMVPKMTAPPAEDTAVKTKPAH